VKFVAIGSHDEAVAGMRLPGQDQEAHVKCRVRI
jgi:hypothetical protein